MKSPAPDAAAASPSTSTPPPDEPGVRFTRPHRCNDRVEDLIQTLTAGHFTALPTAARALAACLRSDPGSEPRPPAVPYTTIADGEACLAPRRLDLRGKR